MVSFKAVGLAAKQCLQRNPSSTIQAVKQILGKNIDHRDVVKQMSSGPVKVRTYLFNFFRELE